jgi:hypothetical protein
LLKELRGSKSQEELDRSWRNFKLEFPDNKTGRFIQYMEKHWLAIEKRPTWVLYVREVG